MRTVKAVLLTASAFKRAMPQENEENLLHRALGDCNVPKLLAEDIPLFKGIMADLFPDIEIKERDYKDLLETIREVCKQMKLQGIPEFEEKCLQVYETQRVIYFLF
jgi:dynein heavy chain